MRSGAGVTPDALRAMDGSALTRLAWELGLAPESVTTHPLDVYGSGKCYINGDERAPWEPHTNLAQADAVFRSLRTRGWSTAAYWFQAGTYGHTQAHRAGGYGSLYWGEGDDIASEPHALLLTSVLAVTSAQHAAPNA